METLGILVGKAVCTVGRVLNRGSSLPGVVATKISPNLFNQIEYPKEVIMVTGTNGKTSTTHYIADIVQATSMKVIHNKEGANMPQGIKTAVLEQVSVAGDIQADVCTFEVDEGFLGNICDIVTPKYLVITNLFEDQADRFGSVEKLAHKIKESIPKDTILVLNGNDPVLVHLGNQCPDNAKIYFGLSKIDDHKILHHEDVQCPNCQRILNYDYRLYDKLGSFSCECGLTTPVMKYLATDIHLEERTFKVNDFEFHSKYANKYFIYNMVAAIAICRELGITNSIIDRTLSSYTVGNGRMEEVVLGEHKTFLNLVKNTAGLNQSLEYILANTSQPFNLYLAINNKPADGEDSSWLESVSFDHLKDSSLAHMVIAGEQVQYLKEVLLANGIKEESIHIEEDPKKAVEWMKHASEHPIFLSNYTALKAIRDELMA